MKVGAPSPAQGKRSNALPWQRQRRGCAANGWQVRAWRASAHLADLARWTHVTQLMHACKRVRRCGSTGNGAKRPRRAHGTIARHRPPRAIWTTPLRDLATFTAMSGATCPHRARMEEMRREVRTAVRVRVVHMAAHGVVRRRAAWAVSCRGSSAQHNSALPPPPPPTVAQISKEVGGLMMAAPEPGALANRAVATWADRPRAS